MNSWPLLSIIIWLPILGGLLLLPFNKDNQKNCVRWSALAISIISLALSGVLWYFFDSSTANMQFVEHHAWIPAFNAYYALGIDGIALPLILLTAFCTVLVCIAGWQVIQDRVAAYYASFLMMQGIIIGVFSATDALLFYVFWEVMLIPMFLIIGIWGGPNRVYATIKFFLYTFLGSIFMLVALIYLYMQSGDFMIASFYDIGLPHTIQMWLFFGFLFAFAVKIPMFPVHTWLPDAHVEAPTGGSVILAAILLKLGGYGFLRFSVPIAPEASLSLANFMIALSLIAVIYIGFVAIVQKDLKKLIAYSSIAHMGFVTLGIFMAIPLLLSDGATHATMGVEGAMVQMISHGFISAAMFLCVGVLYDRMHTRQIADFGGVANAMPAFAAFMMLFAMANVGLPGTSGFVGEFLVILSAFKLSFLFAAFAAATLLLAPAYTLWMVKRVMFGEIANEKVAALKDITPREAIFLVMSAVFVIGLGVWPEPLLAMMRSTIEHWVLHLQLVMG
jgi:NADH-quinone oxidoreductase subunit M